jgi:hypothetical protein
MMVMSRYRFLEKARFDRQRAMLGNKNSVRAAWRAQLALASPEGFGRVAGDAPAFFNMTP